jgi:uncharacterized protein YaiE (UPF0345 family)
MSEFKNVTIIKEANVYFDGKVTVGRFVRQRMQENPGDHASGMRIQYRRSRTCEILSGEMDVLLPGKNEWQTVTGGEFFDVTGDSLFKLKVKKVTDYCCSFIS